MTAASSDVLAHSLEREVLICAPRETVFRFFTDSERFASWWGPGSTIDPRPGGEVCIRYPNAVVARGQVVVIEPPARIVMTYGYEGQDAALPPGGSRVTITLETHAEGTRLHLRHDLPTPVLRDHHVGGWRYQLALFANAVAREAHAGAERLVDRYFALWSEPDRARRLAELTAIAVAEVRFRDPLGATAGCEDLADHVGAAQYHMPGITLHREGPVRHCQGTALADWTARTADGTARARGTNVFDLAPDGRVLRIVGLPA